MKIIIPDKVENDIAYFNDKASPLDPTKPMVTRTVAHVILINRATDEILCLDWPKHNWKALIVGGVEEGEDMIEAAKREVEEETGYQHIAFVAELGKTSAVFYAEHKQENRTANATGLIFELVDDARGPIAEEESKNHTPVWIKKSDVENFLNLDNQLYLWNQALEYFKSH